MNLKTIRNSFHVHLLNVRNLNYILQSEDFAIAYKSASSSERRDVERAIERIDKTTVNRFIKEQLLKLTPFYQMSVKQLREIGRNVSIPEYWNKDKTTLVAELENVVERLKKSGK